MRGPRILGEPGTQWIHVRFEHEAFRMKCAAVTRAADPLHQRGGHRADGDAETFS